MLKTDHALMTDQGLVEMPDAELAGDPRDTRPFTGPPAEAERLPLDTIIPSGRNPRTESGLEIDSLAASIHEYGLLQPVLVRRISESGDEERYELIAGHRRRLAFLMLREQYPFEPRWRTIPAVIRHEDDAKAYVMLLTSQVHTVEFTTEQTATAIDRLLAEGMEQQDVARILHKSEGWVSKYSRIFRDPVLSAPVQLPVNDPRRLSMGVAEELLTVENPATRRQLAEQAVEEKWSQKDARQAARTSGLGRTVLAAIRLVRELRPLLGEIHPEDLAATHVRELDGLRLDLVRLAQRPKRGAKREVIMPSIETAQSVAGIGQRALDNAARRARRVPGARLRHKG